LKIMKKIFKLLLIFLLSLFLIIRFAPLSAAAPGGGLITGATVSAMNDIRCALENAAAEATGWNPAVWNAGNPFAMLGCPDEPEPEPEPEPESEPEPEYCQCWVLSDPDEFYLCANSDVASDAFYGSRPFRHWQDHGSGETWRPSRYNGLNPPLPEACQGGATGDWGDDGGDDGGGGTPGDDGGGGTPGDDGGGDEAGGGGDGDGDLPTPPSIELQPFDFDMDGDGQPDSPLEIIECGEPDTLIDTDGDGIADDAWCDFTEVQPFYEYFLLRATEPQEGRFPFDMWGQDLPAYGDLTCPTIEFFSYSREFCEIKKLASALKWLISILFMFKIYMFL
jgi:hypothetical protein